MEEDKARRNNYRPATDQLQSCLSCNLKHAVPWMWCPQIGRQVETDKTCDKHHSDKCHVDH